jgi:hypothetical protein
MTWSAHQDEPKLCPLARSRYNLRPKNGANPLDALRRSLSISVVTVAAQCGISQSSAQRVLTGHIGGKGGASEAAANRVTAFVHDIARDSVDGS